MSLEVSTAEDFADGELLCPELDSFDVPSTPVEGLDAEAYWVNDKIDPNEGTLRLCTDTYMLGIDIESPDGSRDPATDAVTGGRARGSRAGEPRLSRMPGGAFRARRANRDVPIPALAR